MNIGDFVKVRKGLKDPDYQKFDMSEWTGIISKKFDTQEGEMQAIAIQWDIDTLKKLPIEFVKSAIEDGCEFGTMHLTEVDVQIINNDKRDNEKEREKLILDLERKYEYAGFDDQENRISDILESTNIHVNIENLKKYRTFLIQHLKGRILLNGVEDFPWEERFVFGFGSEKEYAQLRKTRPSYKDTFKLVKILSADEYQGDLLVKVQRQSDRRAFKIPLSQLKCIDEKSDNYTLLDDFSAWVVNY